MERGEFMSTPDRVAATLAGIRERNEQLRHRYGYVGGLLALADAKDDVPRLLAAVDAALGHHVPAVIEDGAPPVYPFRYCKTCSGHPAWPCPEVAAITTALAAQEHP